MKKKVIKFLYLLFVTVLVLSCSTTSTITADENSISVAMGNTKDFNEAVSKAAKQAEKHCNKFDKSAKLDRTEKAGSRDRAGVAYFTCEAKSSGE